MAYSDAIIDLNIAIEAMKPMRPSYGREKISRHDDWLNRLTSVLDEMRQHEGETAAPTPRKVVPPMR